MSSLGGCGSPNCCNDPQTSQSSTCLDSPSLLNSSSPSPDPQTEEDWLEDVTNPPGRDPIILREQVLLQLRRIIDPDLYRDIVSLGFVRDLTIDYDRSSVAFTLELTTPACPVKDMFLEEAERLLKDLGWIDHVDINLTSRKSGALSNGTSGNLSGVSHIIAIASCKGGVGKSSIACNMAFMLSSLGARVGLVDADVYGPSLPYLIGLESPRIYFSSKEDYSKSERSSVEYEGQHEEGQSKKSIESDLVKGEGGLIPLSYAGVKLMSYGYLKTSNFAPVRGPIASNVVFQMITQTLWGDLDYLLIDMPPGTGDIHLTVAQAVPVTAAVMVTTPQQLSTPDLRMLEDGLLEMVIKQPIARQPRGSKSHHSSTCFDRHM